MWQNECRQKQKCQQKTKNTKDSSCNIFVCLSIRQFVIFPFSSMLSFHDARETTNENPTCCLFVHYKLPPPHSLLLFCISYTNTKCTCLYIHIYTKCSFICFVRQFITLICAYMNLSHSEIQNLCMVCKSCTITYTT